MGKTASSRAVVCEDRGRAADRWTRGLGFRARAGAFSGAPSGLPRNAMPFRLPRPFHQLLCWRTNAMQAPLISIIGATGTGKSQVRLLQFCLRTFRSLTFSSWP